MTTPEEDMIPYIFIKFPNGDEVIAEVVSETPLSLIIRNGIQLKKVYVADKHGLKVQKSYSLSYTSLMVNNEAYVPKTSCLLIGPLKYELRSYYELLVDHHIKNKKAEAEYKYDDVENDTQTPEDQPQKEKPKLH
jgi:hypothetical protein